MNYKDTLFLPETEFSMKASLPTNEPKILDPHPLVLILVN